MKNLIKRIDKLAGNLGDGVPKTNSVRVPRNPPPDWQPETWSPYTNILIMENNFSPKGGWPDCKAIVVVPPKKRQCEDGP